MEEKYKEVYFDQYCETCKHKETPEGLSPCCWCLENPMNLYSHKPTHWEAKDKNKK
jgi:hypothetical protein|nr:MAG TPA: hypothetical protein [Caudoviricetes sp.]